MRPYRPALSAWTDGSASLEACAYRVRPCDGVHPVGHSGNGAWVYRARRWIQRRLNHDGG
jgi:hypothetical protein